MVQLLVAITKYVLTTTVLAGSPEKISGYGLSPT